MAAESVLRSYLLAVGFKIDEEGYRKFKDRQENIDKRNTAMRENLKKFAETAVAAAGVLTTSVIKISDRLNALYYSSELAGSSAKNLAAFKSAAEQVGISADQAQSVVTNLGSALRTMPGLTGILQSMNINPNQDSVKVLIDLVDKLHTLPYFQAVQYAKLFGIDEPTLKLMEDHRSELGKLFSKYQELNKGTREQTEESRKFHNALADLETRFSKLWDIIATRFMPVGEKVISWLSRVIDLFISADKTTEGWSSRLLGVVSAFTSVIGSVKGLKAVMHLLGIGGETAAEAGGAAEMGAAAVGGGLASGPGAIIAPIAALDIGATLLSRKVQNTKFGKWFAEQSKDAPEMQGQGTFGLDEHGNVSLHNPGNLRAAPGAATVERFRGTKSIGRFAQFSSDEEGLGAMANLLKGKLYFSGGFDTISKIINRYAPSSENDSGAYIKDVAKRMGISSDTRLNLLNADTLSSLMQAMIHHEQGRDPFSSDMISRVAKFKLGEDAGRSQVTVNQNPKVDIHVNGARDPHTVAKDVLDGQARINSKMQRDGQGAVR